MDGQYPSPLQPGDPGSRVAPTAWQPPAPEELQEQIASYKILDILGCGGMGAVYKGWQVSLERYVAVKILSPEIEAGDAHFAARFKQEAKTMARFLHPGIVAVFDAGETPSGLLYIVMEYVEGTDVFQMVKSQGRLAPEHALAIASHVCDALQYAHDQGVVHRDIKPANIMVNTAGQVKVADFGLAKGNGPGNRGLTRTDVAMGTPDYVAPEVLVAGTVADHRADLYAVGVMLYNMLTGEIPRGRFKLPSEKAGTDPRFDAIINRAMETERQDRYQSAREVRRDLDAIISTPIPQATEPPSPPLRSKPLMKIPQRRDPGAATPPLQKGSPPARASRATLIVGTIVVAALSVGGWLIFGGKSPSATQAGHPPASAPAETSENATPPVPAPRPPSLAPPAAPQASFEEAAKDHPFVNLLGMKFIPVPIPNGPSAGQRVLFCLWETRVQDYAVFAKETSRDWRRPSFPQGPTEPAVGVSWNDAQDFCAWMTERERSALRISVKEIYRLPTDHEWSCAVGIGDKEDPLELPKDKTDRMRDVFPWGTEWPPPHGAGNFADETAKKKLSKPGAPFLDGYDDGYVWTAPVGSFTPSKSGLYDLSGNVWEWCQDWYDLEHTLRVLRGGSHDFFVKNHLLSDHRGSNQPTSRTAVYGFRVVLSETGNSRRN